MAKALRWIALLAVLLAPPARAEWADWQIDPDLETRYDTNLNQSSERSEQEWAVSFHPSLDIGRAFQFGNRTRLYAGAALAGDIFTRFENLNTFDGGGEVSLFHKFGLGDAPWVRAFATGGYQEVVADQRSVSRSAPRRASASRRASMRGSNTPSRTATEGRDPPSSRVHPIRSSICSTTWSA